MMVFLGSTRDGNDSMGSTDSFLETDFSHIMNHIFNVWGKSLQLFRGSIIVWRFGGLSQF